jgi:hypothetical protein
VQEVVLSFLAESMDEELWSHTEEHLLILAKGQARSTSTRVKAISCIGAGIRYHPETIESLINALTDEIPRMTDKSLIYSVLGLFETAVKTSEVMALLTLKGVYLFLDFSQNWVRVHTIKLVDKLINLEPRLAKKVETKLYSFLVTTNAKSVECELLKLAIHHFKYNDELFELVRGKTEVFLDSNDLNLNIIGFKTLRDILQAKPKLLQEYSDKLSAKAQEEHPLLAREIFSIYRDNLTASDADQFVKQLANLLAKAKNPLYKEELMRMLFTLSERNPPVISDWSFLAKEVLGQLVDFVKHPADIKAYIGLLLSLQTKHIDSELIGLYLQIIFGFFEKVNIHSTRTTSHPHFELVLQLLATLCSMSSELLYRELLGENCQHRDNFFMVLQLATALRDRLDLVQDSLLLNSLLSLKNRLTVKDVEKFSQEIIADCLTSTRDKLALETELTFLISDSTQLAKDVEDIDLSGLTIDPGLCDLTAEVELSEKEVEILTRSLDLTQTDDRKRLLLQPTANT